MPMIPAAGPSGPAFLLSDLQWHKQAIPDLFIDRLTAELGLDRRQLKEALAVAKDVNKKTKKTQMQMNRLRKQLKALDKGLQKNVGKGFSQIRKKLDSGQAEKFDEILSKLERFRDD